VAFLKEFLLIGILKFIASCSEFASPIILNRIVTFMEDKSIDGRYGSVFFDRNLHEKKEKLKIQLLFSIGIFMQLAYCSQESQLPFAMFILIY